MSSFREPDSLSDPPADNETDPETDEKRMETFRDTGDETILAALIQKYSGQLRRYFREAGRRSDADDLTQEVFVCVFRFKDQYEPGKPFINWLYAIATRRMRDLHRREHRQRRVVAGSFSHVSGSEEYSFDPADDTEMSGFDGFELEAIRAAVENLPRDERNVIEAVFFRGLSWRQASRSLGVSHGSFCTLMTKAMQRLRERFRRKPSAA